MPSNERSNTPKVRQAVPSDIPSIYGLVNELAAYERMPDAVTATLEMYVQDFYDGIFKAIVLDLDSRIIGTAIYYLTYSTWRGRMMYLEDFIITEQFRRRGFGKLLFDGFLEKSRTAGVKLVKWQVLSWNTPAIRFYQKHYPAIFDEEWINGKILFAI